MRPRTVGGKELWPPEMKEKLRSMWARDAQIKVIALELGKSVTSVKKMRAQLGLPVRRSPDGQQRDKHLKVCLNEAEMTQVRRAAYRVGRTPQTYVKMLLKRDGAL